MQAGQLYAGTLPAPPSDEILVHLADTSKPTREAQAGDGGNRTISSGESDWGAALHYVAGRFGNADRDSVLLTRGSTLETARWVSCAKKPEGMIIDLEAAVSQTGVISEKVVGVLGALETIDVPMLYTTTRKDAALARAIAGFDAVRLRKPELGKTLFLNEAGKEAAVRAAISGSFCVIAIVGSRAEDFPNKATPEIAGVRWSPGWFVVPAPNS